jgi:hypothetical protein
MIRHMSLNIAGFLRNVGKKNLKGFMQDENGKDLTDKEVRIYLAECQAKGWRKIPCGDCDGFDYFDKGCPGHEKIKPKKETV